jgi:hypothetical protein
VIFQNRVKKTEKFSERNKQKTEMSSDLKPIWESLLKDLLALDSVPMNSYCDRLYNKARGSTRAKGHLAKYLKVRNKYPPDDGSADNQTLDEREIFFLLGRLADSAAAKALSEIDDEQDTLGLKKCVNPVSKCYH